MSFLVDRNTRVLIQGITGQLGVYVTELMSEAGYLPVAGVTPGRGGTSVGGVPVFDTVAEAADQTGCTASLVLVPPSGLRDAALEAIHERMDPIALMVDGVPLNLSIELLSKARESAVTLIGPNSPGIISPGQCLLGALDPSRFTPGEVAVVSRSGGMMSTIADTLARAGIGTSTCIGIGGDSVIGIDMPTAVTLAEKDPDTRAIVIFGEIGTTQEERLAELIRKGQVGKPVVAYIAGAAAPAGIRYSHAGAQADGPAGSAQAKMATLAEAGAHVVERYVSVGQLTRELLG
ncbi:succinate--CoA ligase subunit alpha [Acrocarpospora macrocephala]|uniref:Succinyl-CoA synthetase subunit alpha n=1 Tax=Acrocarpospora macrocephala TaxID=150177 RepID=A0A5M3WFX1_9ACTN|nr:succinate--CoA ligase subunit alpha [Acrocarpospora macrocephala]GES08005.1 succinyl-CoA synthetase subunit alpha [Acrocarpospora macrocephala]